MKKYLNITKMVILEQLQYMFNKVTGLIMYALFIFIFLQLWRYMYGSNELIEGYTLNQMTWYMGVTEILWYALKPKSIRKNVTNDIKSGKIAYTLNKPYDYIKYLISEYYGYVLIDILLYLVVGTLISLIIIGPLNTFSIESIPFILITTLNASIINVLLYIIISLTAFWFEDNTPFFWIYEKFVLVIGVSFPVEIFPSYIQPIIRYSPVYGTMYAPAKMVIDYSFNSFLEILPFQVLYIVGLYILCRILYKKGEKNLSVNGG